MNARTVAKEELDRPRIADAVRPARLLVGGYFTISILTLVAIILLRNDASIVNSAVWIRGTIVAATSLLMFSFTGAAGRGSHAGYRRLRLASGAMVAAIAVIISLPGTFPTWLKIEQGVCGLILIGVVVIVNGRNMRSLFAAK
ncbi:MAG TPA: hypothetical protein VHX38_41445 [Pseudonocardiaceae bacterium]|jgi:hypothetical protein|nr:hypothetical protein [Pseudonocardiaceae bacterium]